MFPNGTEGLVEFRRTGYPLIFPGAPTIRPAASIPTSRSAAWSSPQSEYSNNGAAVQEGRQTARRS